MYIKATKNSKSYGYVKNINYESGEVQLVDDRRSALKYTNKDEVHDDIDFLTKKYFESGYVFTY